MEMEAEEANGSGDMSIDDGEGLDAEQSSEEVIDLTGSTSTEEDGVQYISPVYYDLTRSRPNNNHSDTSADTQSQASDAESDPSTASAWRTDDQNVDPTSISTSNTHSATTTNDVPNSIPSNTTDRRTPRTSPSKPTGKGRFHHHPVQLDTAG